MIRRIVVAAALAGGLLASTMPAGATCQPGRIGIDPNTGRPSIQLPRCQPPPQ